MSLHSFNRTPVADRIIRPITKARKQDCDCQIPADLSPSANLYYGARTNVSTDKAVKWYIANGATAGKINMGIPLYGRAFENTNGIGSSYNGVSCLTLQLAHDGNHCVADRSWYD